MKTIDCPLCGQKDAIGIGTESQRIFTPRPGPKRIGGYSIGYEHEEDDFSHAETCPELVKAFHKRDLLEYYVCGEGGGYTLHVDPYSYEYYEEALSKLGLGLNMYATREGKKINEKTWKYLVYIGQFTRAQFLKTVAKDPDKAFELLKHRLLCGDIINTGFKKFQLENIPGKVTFKEV